MQYADQSDSMWFAATCIALCCPAPYVQYADHSDSMWLAATCIALCCLTPHVPYADQSDSMWFAATCVALVCPLCKPLSLPANHTAAGHLHCSCLPVFTVAGSNPVADHTQCIGLVL